MKKTFLFLIICLGTFASIGQRLNHTAVPGQVKKVFTKIYPNTQVTWQKEEGNYEANFLRAGKKMSTVINDNGNIIETQVQIGLSQLPSRIKNYINLNYKNAPIKEAAKITKANGVVNYEAEINQGTLLFDAAGNFTRIEPREKGKKA